jgi:hypothetical protein
MRRVQAGLLAALAAASSVTAGTIHGVTAQDLAIAGAALIAGVGAYAVSPSKKLSHVSDFGT